MLVKTYCAAVNGMEVTPITVEVSIRKGVHFHLVGLPDTAVKESYERIRAALNNVNIKLPQNDITVNLSPADIQKSGSGYDLPITIAMLAANDNVATDKLQYYMIMAELGLDGRLCSIRGALPIAMKAKELGFHGIILPKENVKEAAVVQGIDVYGMGNILEVMRFLNGELGFEPTTIDVKTEFFDHQQHFEFDFADVKGQQSVKRALEVAAAGGHNIILVGPPGSGKSMMAKCLPSILPPLSIEESLETTQIYSVAGKLGKDVSLISKRPFRSPHHTISSVAIVGGGTTPQPGEISLAHNGVLYADELPEFRRDVLEVLRQPLEDRRITVSRVKYSIDYPSSFMFVASMNPCPCGYHNDPTHHCTCSPGQIQRYMHKISGPLMDRIDLQIELQALGIDDLINAPKGEPSAMIRERVVRARKIQEERFRGLKGIHCNAQMKPAQIRKFAQLDEHSTGMLKMAMERLKLSARAYDRIIKVARTIADLDGKQNIEVTHIAEAVGYRNLDRSDWVE